LSHYTCHTTLVTLHLSHYTRHTILVTLHKHMFICCVVCLQSSLAKLGIPLNDVLRVLVAVMLLGNVSFYESKEQELGIQGSEGGGVVNVSHDLQISLQS